MTDAQATAADYESSLGDLVCNSKPLINMLTMLADESIAIAPLIVQTIVKHLIKVPGDITLPVLYLVDSILKNVGKEYISLFSQCLVPMFCGAFAKVDEKTRSQMHKLRMTWNDVLPATKLHELDIKVASLDPAWPVANLPSATSNNRIHLNPKFLTSTTNSQVTAPTPLTFSPTPIITPEASVQNNPEVALRTELLNQQRNKGNKLSNRKLQLELKRKELEALTQARLLMEKQNEMEKQKEEQLRAMKALESRTPSVIIMKPELSAEAKLAAEIAAIIKASNQPHTTPEQQAALHTLLLKNRYVQEQLAKAQQAGVLQMPGSASAKATFVPSCSSTTATSFTAPISAVNPSVSVPVSTKIPAQTPSSPDVSIIKSVPATPPPTSSRSPTSKSQQMVVSKSDATSPVATRITISPANPALIQAATQRVRDPRLRKIKEDKPADPSLPALKITPEPLSETTTTASPLMSFSDESAALSTESSKLEKFETKFKRSTKDKEKRRRLKKRCKQSQSRPSSPIVIPEKTPKTGKVDVEGSAPVILCPAENSVVGMKNTETSAEVFPKTAAVAVSPIAVDVDLRVLPTSPKKRTSDNNEEPPLKRSKAEIFNQLFGNEDVDLRQLPQPQVPIALVSPSTVTPSINPVFDSPTAMTLPSPGKSAPIVPSSDTTEPSKSVPAVSKTSSKKESAKGSSSKKDSSSVSRTLRSTRSESKKSKEKLISPKKSRKSPSPPSTKTPSPPPPPIISNSRDSPLKESTKENSRSWAKYKEVKPDVFKSPYRIPSKRFNPRQELKQDSSRNGSCIQHSSPLSYRSESNLSKDLRFNDDLPGVNSYRSSYYTDNKHTHTDSRMEMGNRRMESNSDLMGIGERRGDHKLDLMGTAERRIESKPDLMVVQDRQPEPKTDFMDISESRIEPKIEPVERLKSEPVDDEYGLHVGIRGHGVLPDGGGGRHNLLEFPHGPELRMPMRPEPHPEANRSPNHPLETQPPLLPPQKPLLPPPPMQPMIVPPCPVPQQHSHPLPRPPLERAGPHQRLPGPFNPPPYSIRHGFPPRGRHPAPHLKSDFQPVDPKLLEICKMDAMQTINIDGIPREIRFYDQTAVVFLSPDDPREIRFQEGYRNVLFNEDDSIELKLNDEAVDFELDGKIHKIRLGAPTRELYIDGKGFALGWNQDPIPIFIDGKQHRVQLEGEPPPVTICTEKRLDLVAGKINLVIDGEIAIPIYLDYKPQSFIVDGKPYVLQFKSALERVMINDRVFRTDFGGYPKPLLLNGIRHFLRLSELPKGIVPGQISLYGMEDFRPNSPPIPQPKSEDGPQLHPALDHSIKSKSKDRKYPLQGPSKLTRQNTKKNASAGGGTSAPEIEKLSAPLDLLARSAPSKTNFAASRVQPKNSSESVAQQKPQGPFSALGQDINVNELFQKLVEIGIVGNQNSDVKKEETNDALLKPVDFAKPETLKVRQPAMITILYSGIQCSTCGLRFPAEFTDRYSQHLDWHFRQNRRERDSARVVQSRQWYYDISDWIQFEEIEVLEERVQSWFESQVIDEDGREIPGELLSIPAGSDTAEGVCELCHDPFELFFHEETEEWHFRHAICIDKKLYHPICHQDWLLSLELEAAENARREQEEEEDKRIEEKKKKEELEAKEAEEQKSLAENVKKEKDLDEAQKEETEVNVKVDQETEIKVETSSIEQSVAVKSEAMEVTGEEEMKKEPGTEENEIVVMTEEFLIKEEPQEEIMEADVPEESKENVIAADIVIKKEDEDPSVLLDSQVDTTYTAVTSSIDGNVELLESSQVSVGSSNKIKINISKSSVIVPSVEEESNQPPMEETELIPSSSEVAIDPDQPFPPGLEPPELPVVKLKPRLVGRKLTEYPPIQKGTELSGLCSIM